MEDERLTEVEEKLNWETPDFPRLGAFVRSTLAPFVGGSSFYASLAWKGHPKTKKTYASPDEWEAALTSAPDEMQVNLRSDETGRQLSVWLYESGRRGSVTVKAADEDVDEARRLVREMLGALGLPPSDEAANGKRVELSRVYRAGPDNGREWFTSFAAFLKSAVRGATDADCQYRLSAPAGWDYTYRDFDAWMADLLRDWAKVAHLSYDLRGPAEGARVEWELAAGEFRLRLRAGSEERARALSDALERQAGLTPLVGNPYRQRLQGEQNFYFAKNPTTFEWFSAAVGELFKYAGDAPGYTEFSVTKSGAQPRPVIWQEKEPWLEFVRDNWEQIMQARCYISSAGLNCTFEFEPLHDWVALRIQAPNRSRVLEITQDMEGRLGLQPVEGASYGPVRSSGYYSVGNWSNKGFADAVKRAVELLPKHSIRQAMVIEEKGEAERDHKGFDYIEPFLQRLAQGKPYIEAHLQIKGPRGAQMAVHVTDKCRKLELKSHLPPDQFPDLLKIFDEELGLKKIAETKEQAEGRGRAWQNSLAVTLILPIVLAVLTSTVLSDQFKNAAIPKRSFQVVNPRPEGDSKTVTLPAPQPVDVYWELQTERWFTKRVDTDSPADYRLFANGVLKEEKKNVPPGVRLELAEGTYLMQITSVPTGEQASVIFAVGKTDAKKAEPAGARPTPSAPPRHTK